MKAERSNYIFVLASKCGIPLGQGKLEPMEDSSYQTFKEKYLKWAPQRDVCLLNHLSANPNLFRVHLAYTQRVLGLASQIVWYFDEIIIQDPLLSFFSNESNDIEEQKYKLRKLIQVLAIFRRPIEDGTILFTSSPATSQLPVIPEPTVDLLLANSEIRNALKESANCSYAERLNKDGLIVKMYRMELDHGATSSSSINQGIKTNSTISIPLLINEKLAPVSSIELAKLIQNDPFERVGSTFTAEIAGAINVFNRARFLNAAVLYDRKLDGLIIAKAGIEDNSQEKNAPIEALNLAVPFLQGVPPENLNELRLQLPDAFKEFRAHLLEIVFRCNREGYGNLELKNKIDKELISNIRYLESEFKATLKKTKFTIISTIGIASASLTGMLPWIPASILVTMGIPAIAKQIKTNEKLKGNPFYFLWKAQDQSKI